jgi:hypothetical protein
MAWPLIDFSERTYSSAKNIFRPTKSMKRIRTFYRYANKDNSRV